LTPQTISVKSPTNAGTNEQVVDTCNQIFAINRLLENLEITR
jgi:hypothetical protein